MNFFFNYGRMLIGTWKFFEEKRRFFQGVFAFVFNESLKHYLTKIMCFVLFFYLFFPGHISDMDSPNSVWILKYFLYFNVIYICIFSL